MVTNDGPSLGESGTASGRLDGRLKGRAQEWLTRKMAYGFFPAPQSEADCRQRYHLIRELYAGGDVLRAELWRVPPHERVGKDQQLFERMEREVEEVRIQQAELRARAGIETLATTGKNSARVAYERSSNRLEIHIHPWRSPFLTAVLPLWVLISGILTMNAVLGIFGRGPMPWGPVGGLLVGIPFALLTFYSALYWLWIQGGTETIVVGPAGLQVQGDLMHWHGERTFRLEGVQHLRYSRPRKGEGGNAVVVGAASVASPTVAFHFEGKTWRFGSELDEASALAVIAAIEKHLPG